MIEKEIVKDTSLIAYCGLYCAACRGFAKGTCAGCAKNEKATWCKVRACCISNNYQSCADCHEFNNAMDCKKFNNFMSKAFGFVFKSDRNACITLIKERGYENFMIYMADNKLQTIKR